jgi:hypothetical protein
MPMIQTEQPERLSKIVISMWTWLDNLPGGGISLHGCHGCKLPHSGSKMRSSNTPRNPKGRIREVIMNLAGLIKPVLCKDENFKVFSPRAATIHFAKEERMKISHGN